MHGCATTGTLPVEQLVAKATQNIPHYRHALYGMCHDPHIQCDVLLTRNLQLEGHLMIII